ncbi:MAG TPA: hypothetical protein VLK29_09980 [Luteimonas sp.]|nr:hypothetical protein [Luteimonas sp.]
MKPYPARAGESGVTAYEDIEGGIAVQFQGGKVYVYRETGIGTDHLVQLRRAATRGAGLASYISRHVHDGYDAMYDSAAAWRRARR